jgi:carbonic anhydrase/acetyltransferase-like protein (isoleucine patch superfamily)
MWGFDQVKAPINDLGPGDFSTGIFDPQWVSPFVAFNDRTAKIIRTMAYKMHRITTKLLGDFPKEDLYRLRRIVSYGGVRPQVRDNCFVAPNAVVIGDVIVGRKSTVGYNAVVRGDYGPIRIGESACVNDKVVLHGPVNIGKWATIDPLAVIDNADVASCSMVGSASVVSPGCRIESGAMLCSASVLRPGTTVPSGEIWSGNPAMKLGTLTDEEKGYIIKAAKHMVLLNLEHTQTWEVTWEDHENYRIGRELWSTWATHMYELRVRPFYMRSGPKDTGRAVRSPLEIMAGRMDGGRFESGNIAGESKGMYY